MDPLWRYGYACICSNSVINMELKQGYFQLDSIDEKTVRQQAEQSGYMTFVLHGNIIHDQVSFFNAVRTTLPLDPPLTGTRSWDALSDSLWEGLQTHAAQRIAILWSNAEVMANSALSDFEIALSVLTDIANSLADPESTSNSPKEVALLIERRKNQKHI